MKIKNKKAIVLPEVIRLIIAVLCIILLIMLAVQVYSIFTRSNELEQAKATLNEIMSMSSQLEKLGDSTNLLVIAPKEWSIVSIKDKLCICKISGDPTQVEKECSVSGTCQNIKATIYYFCGQANPKDIISNCLAMSQKESPGAQKLPFQLFLTKGVDGLILSVKPYSQAKSGDLTKGFFSSYLDSVLTDTLKTTIKNYIETPNEVNKAKVVKEINSNSVIKSASASGYNWQLKLWAMDTKVMNEFIYSYDSKNSCETTDYSGLAGIDTTRGFINLGIYLCKLKTTSTTPALGSVVGQSDPDKAELSEDLDASLENKNLQNYVLNYIKSSSADNEKLIRAQINSDYTVSGATASGHDDYKWQLKIGIPSNPPTDKIVYSYNVSSNSCSLFYWKSSTITLEGDERGPATLELYLCK